MNSEAVDTLEEYTDEVKDLLLRALANRASPNSNHQPVDFRVFANKAKTIKGSGASPFGDAGSQERKTCRKIYDQYLKRAGRGTDLNIPSNWSYWSVLERTDDLVVLLASSSSRTSHPVGHRGTGTSRRASSSSSSRHQVAAPKTNARVRAMSTPSTFLTTEQKEELESTAAALATHGKGITACDESAGTIGKRFDAVGIENTEENRRLYRQMLFTAPTCKKYLCGAILDPETLLQKSDDGTLFPELLKKNRIACGVKPHLKVYTLPGTGGDTVMQGLDSLAVRCKDYYDAGARFAKWRSPIVIDLAAGRPTDLAVKSNMADLARYALICQSEGLMPIVEPDVSLSGDHTLEEAVAINTKVLAELFKQMIDHGVYMAGTTLKSNIINPGKDCPTSYTVEEIGKANVAVLEQTFPVAMKTANYLSGGQSLEDAAARLSAINKANEKGPWNLSFSWSAALQLPLMELCKGKDGVLPLDAMSKLYIKELKIAAAASKGEWDGSAPGDGDHKGSNKKRKIGDE